MTKDGLKAVVQTEEGVTKDINILNGVRQGDGLSATLFNITVEGIIISVKSKDPSYKKWQN